MRTKIYLIKYLHLACWSPTVATWCDAIDLGYFATFPGLTSSQVRKYFPKSITTAKGNLKQVRKNLRSTNTSHSKKTNKEHIMTASDYPSGTNARTNLVTFKLVSNDAYTGIVATDQTGKFPTRSSQGNQYLMVAYIQDANAILAIPLKNRSKTSIVNAYSSIYDKLTATGLKPKVQICDNECPKSF